MIEIVDYIKGGHLDFSMKINHQQTSKLMT